MNGLHVVKQWIQTPEALVYSLLFANLVTRDSMWDAQFIFRYVFVSIALWVPSVVRKTARKFPQACFPGPNFLTCFSQTFIMYKRVSGTTNSDCNQRNSKHGAVGR